MIAELHHATGDCTGGWLSWGGIVRCRDCGALFPRTTDTAAAAHQENVMAHWIRRLSNEGAKMMEGGK